RIVRRDHDVLAAHRAAVGLQRARLVAEFAGFGMLVNLPAKFDDGVRHASKIFARMEPGLIRKAHGRHADERNRLDVFGVEPELSGKGGLSFEPTALSALTFADRRMKV